MGAVTVHPEVKNLTLSQFSKEYLPKGSLGTIRQTILNGESLLYAEFHFEPSQRVLKGEIWREARDARMYCDTGNTDRHIMIYFDSKLAKHKALIAKLAGLEAVVSVPKRATSTHAERVQARRDRMYAQARIDSRKKKQKAA